MFSCVRFLNVRVLDEYLNKLVNNNSYISETLRDVKNYIDSMLVLEHIESPWVLNGIHMPIIESFNRLICGNELNCVITNILDYGIDGGDIIDYDIRYYLDYFKNYGDINSNWVSLFGNAYFVDKATFMRVFCYKINVSKDTENAILYMFNLPRNGYITARRFTQVMKIFMGDMSINNIVNFVSRMGFMGICNRLRTHTILYDDVDNIYIIRFSRSHIGKLVITYKYRGNIVNYICDSVRDIDIHIYRNKLVPHIDCNVRKGRVLQTEYIEYNPL